MKLSWNDFEFYTNQLIQKIRQDNYIPEVIVAVGVSGLIPAMLVAKGLGVKNLEVIVISSYDENNKRLSPKVISNNLSNFLENKNVLVVDDIVATSETMSLVMDLVASFKPKQIKFVSTVVSKFVCKKYPDYYGESIMRTADDFIFLPWDD